jgi:ribosomal protein L14
MYRFLILRARTRFRRHRARRVPFSCFALPESFSAVPKASSSVFMFCVPALIVDVTEDDVYHFLILRARTRFRRHRGRRFPFSCFALQGLFSAVPKASGPMFMFCSPVLIFGVTEGDVYRFLILRARTYFRRHRGRRVPFSCFALPKSFSAVPKASSSIFMFCVPALIVDRTEGDVYCFLILRAQTRFRLHRGRQVPFSCFALPKSFSAVPKASGPVFMFCSPALIFGVTKGNMYRFLILRTRTRFRRHQGRRVPFSCFARSDPFTVVLRASGPVFMFCVPGLVFGGSEGVESRFHVLPFRERFRRCSGRRVPFSCCALPDSFSTIPRPSGLVFKFCAP